MSKKPVIIYGASGYTGRLVCEFLRQYQIPFIAAGRDADRDRHGDLATLELEGFQAVLRQGGQRRVHAQRLFHDALGLLQLLEVLVSE